MVTPMLISAAERGLLPDSAVRFGIRRLLGRRLAEAHRPKEQRLEEMRTSAIALRVDDANEQHYEVPAEFFCLILGSHLKYSSALWPDNVRSLEEAEAAMLRTTAERAGIRDGMRVLDLGCGWGSLSLYLARNFPSCRLTAVSNSVSQRAFIEGRREAEGLTNLTVVTSDINDFSPGDTFDRVVSIEMFEHVRNYEALLRRVAGWLRPDGRLFVHVFCHRELLYFFEEQGDDDWMARRFFSGGLMPSADLLASFPGLFSLEREWRVNGRHYEKTLHAWLRRLDENREAVEKIFVEVYGPENAVRWVRRWRLFLMACEELFGFRGGEEWFVGHYLLRPVGR